MYERHGISIEDKDGTVKPFDALKQEAIEKDLRDRAEANLKRKS